MTIYCVIHFALPSICIIFARDNHYHIKEMFGIGTQEILIIALIILLLFGGKKIPELMRGLGKGVKSFKDGMNSLDEDTDQKKSSEETKKDESRKE